MADSDSEEEGRHPPLLVSDDSDDDDVYLPRGNFIYRIHSDKIIHDTSATNLVQETRYNNLITCTHLITILYVPTC